MRCLGVECAAGEVDVADFAEPALYPPWSLEPLAVSSHPNRFNKCTMAASLLSNDQGCVRPMRAMLVGAAALRGGQCGASHHHGSGTRVQLRISFSTHV